jgi:hypothetical protein
VAIIGNIHIAAAIHRDSVGRGQACRYNYAFGVDAIRQGLLEKLDCLACR